MFNENYFIIFTIFESASIISSKISLCFFKGMAVCTLAAGLLLSDMATEDSMTCHGLPVTNAGLYTALVAIFIYVAFYSLGVGSIPWLIVPELFTSRPRPKAMSIAITVNWLCNFAIAIGFPPLLGAFCGWVFMIFFILLLIFIIYLYIKLPEVAGKPFSEIVQLFVDKHEEQPMSIKPEHILSVDEKSRSVVKSSAESLK